MRPGRHEARHRRAKRISESTPNQSVLALPLECALNATNEPRIQASSNAVIAPTCHDGSATQRAAPITTTAVAASRMRSENWNWLIPASPTASGNGEQEELAPPRKRDASDLPRLGKPASIGQRPPHAGCDWLRNRI